MRSRPPPDISLAVRDGARRLTYAELATVRGISRGSVRETVEGTVAPLVAVVERERTRADDAVAAERIAAGEAAALRGDRRSRS